MKTFRTLIVLVMVATLWSGCIKDNQPIDQPQAVKSMDELVVSPDFNFETFKTIDARLSGYTDGLLEVSSPEGVIYQRSYLKKRQVYNMQLTVPSYEKSLKFKFKEKVVMMPVSSGNIVLDITK